MKNYLLMVDEIGMQMLHQICPMIQFVETRCVPVTGDATMACLVTPIQPPEEAHSEAIVEAAIEHGDVVSDALKHGYEIEQEPSKWCC